LQAARGSLQQPRAKPVFEAGDQLGQGGGRKADIPRRSRKPSGFHGTNEGGHLCSPIHNPIIDEYS
jgi:hypothetical protein